ncbi:hypothetical protein TanjilG_27978 [Lupinus angustifolius]|uniref:Uncharacterized protein n=1 Tax=Lupinus angustifolius TaxID=3871 RepID=A0A4P1RGB2_LUPAN|nr:hypothetical protein TanjilG_27978 [Lupinus angustifolius]
MNQDYFTSNCDASIFEEYANKFLLGAIKTLSPRSKHFLTVFVVIYSRDNAGRW